MYGNPETTTGGYALKFYSSVRMEIRKEHAPQFWVYVDVENGEIQDIHYLSDRSGNG